VLKSKGVDTKSVEIVQVDPNLQLQALQTKQVDALFTADPAATTILQKGLGRLISSEVELPKIFGEPFLFGSFDIRKDFADKNPEIAEKLILAIDKAVEYVNQNAGELKRILKYYLSEPQRPFADFHPDALYQKSSDLARKVFQQIADKYYQIGIIEDHLMVEGLVISKGFSP
jgi:ABC-type nitrate/sulfonate/bicarbonate transport system substrate-binding protein